MLTLLVRAIPTVSVIILPFLFADPSHAAPTRTISGAAAECSADDDPNSPDCAQGVSTGVVQTGSKALIREPVAYFVTSEPFNTKERFSGSAKAGEGFVKVKISQRNPIPVDDGETNVLLEPKKRFGGDYGGNCCRPGFSGGGSGLCCRSSW